MIFSKGLIEIIIFFKLIWNNNSQYLFHNTMVKDMVMIKYDIVMMKIKFNIPSFTYG